MSNIKKKYSVIKHLKYLVFLILFMNIGFTQTLVMEDIQSLDFGDSNSQTAQKFQMANYLLSHSPITQRIKAGDSSDAIELIMTAHSNYQLAVDRARQKNWLEANAIIDSVLRDVTTSAQLLNKKTISKNHYHENLKRVDAFILPKWSELSEDERELLDNISDQISNLLDLVKYQSEAEEYDKANLSLYKVYALKKQLLEKLKHENTVIYDLMFDTPGEEYDYMLKRAQHYQLMVDKVLMENTFSKPKLDQIDVFLQQSKAAMIEARLQEADNRIEQAVIILNQSISDLSNALKVMGIRI